MIRRRSALPALPVRRALPARRPVRAARTDRPAWQSERRREIRQESLLGHLLPGHVAWIVPATVRRSDGDKRITDGAFPPAVGCSRRAQTAVVPGPRGSGGPSCLLCLALPARWTGHRLVAFPLAASEHSVAPGLRTRVDDDPSSPNLCGG